MYIKWCSLQLVKSTELDNPTGCLGKHLAMRFIQQGFHTAGMELAEVLTSSLEHASRGFDLILVFGRNRSVNGLRFRVIP